MSSSALSSAEISRDGASLTWRVHRLRDRPRDLPLIFFGYGLVVALWRVSLPDPFVLLAALLMLTAALGDFLFPVRYRLTAQGAHVDGLLSRWFLDWNDVRRATCGAEGVFLSPLARPSRLDAFRGIRLPYGAESPERLRAAVKAFRKEETA